MAEMRSYIAWANDSRILESSSSGGIFQALAKQFLISGKGTVYGAWQDNSQFIVKHRGVTRTEDIDLLIGSKYYQSDLRKVYLEVKQKLQQKQRVLFSGTPCQIAGLKSYLRASGVNEKDQLLTIEVLCHGISSRRVITRYVDWLEKKSSKKVEKLHFRTKKRRWYDKGSSMEIYYDDGSMRVVDRHADPFYLAFNNNMNLRPSCYTCHFAKIDRVADITIGDFWGAENYIKDKKKLKSGIGLVIVNSDLGRVFWERAQEIITAELIDIEHAISRNGAIIKPAKKPENREMFFDGLDKYDFYELMERCLGKKRLLKIKIKGVIGDERIIKAKRLIRYGS